MIPATDATMPVAAIMGTATAGFYSDANSQTIGTMLHRLTRVTYPQNEETGSPALGKRRTDSVNFTETYAPVRLVGGAANEALRTELVRLTTTTDSHLQSLSRRLDLLTSAFQTFCQQQSPACLTDLSFASGEAGSLPGDDLADLLNQIADGAVVVPLGAAEEARGSLRSNDVVVRAAAARALAFIDPAEARKLLPPAIASEQNTFAASIMRGALRAAEA